MVGPSGLTALLLAALPVFLSFAATNLGVVINITSSLPVGIWREAPSMKIHRGAYVLVCPPVQVARWAVEQSILHKGDCKGGSIPLVKQVIAVESDVLSFDGEDILVNESRMPSLRQSLGDEGLTVVTPFSGWRLPEGKVWLYSPHPKSFDSRYFGGVDVSLVRKVIEPWMVW